MAENHDPIIADGGAPEAAEATDRVVMLQDGRIVSNERSAVLV